MATPVVMGSAVSRRQLLRASLAGASLLPLAIPLRAGAQSATPAAATTAGPGSPATWRTWVLASPDELRPASPAAPTQAEIAELLDLQAKRDDETLDTIMRWIGRPSVLAWTDLANLAYPEFKLTAIRQYRANGLLQTAMYDAVIAAYDAQDAHNRPVPATVDSAITSVAGLAVDRPSFPSADAAVAGAAAAVLTALLPDATPGHFTDLAAEAATSRLQAGLNFRSDVEAGLALGNVIGERVVALAKDDRPQSDWDGSGRLTGPGYWAPTPPAFVETPQEPLASTWHRWVLASPDQFRPAPPPAYDSPAWRSELAAVEEAVANRTLIQAQKARFWQNSAASTLWDAIAADLIARYSLDLPHAARTLAYTAVAVADAVIATWDGKYTYWVARPVTAAADLNVLFPTPPFPSYPAAHSTVSSAAAVVLAHLFPEDATDVLALSEEAAASRTWAGIHFPMDNNAGIATGRAVGYLVADVARHDGAE
jgi:membrane-associated phospholipid phosphatase